MLNPFYDKFLFTNALKFRQNNFFLADIPFLIMPSDLLRGLVEQNNPALNKQVYACIKQATKSYLEPRISSSFHLNKDKVLEFFQNFFSSSGWGFIETINFDRENRRAIVLVKNSPLASALSGKVVFPVDHFFRGVLAALFSLYFQDDFDCIELSCAAQGNEACEFIVKHAHAFAKTTESLTQLDFPASPSE